MRLRRHFLHRPSKGGFSLIEALVVVVVLVVLAACLMPVFGRMRELSNETVCTANMQQLGNGLRYCALENRGLLPLSLNADPQGSGTQVSWQILVQKQLNVPFPKAGQKTVFVCPSASRLYPQPPYRTYGLNLAGGSPTQNPPRLTTLPLPTRTVLLVETMHETNGAGYNALSGSITGNGGKSRIQARHLGHTNLLMADNSVRQIDLDDPELDELLLNIRN